MRCPLNVIGVALVVATLGSCGEDRDDATTSAGAATADLRGLLERYFEES